MQKIFVAILDGFLGSGGFGEDVKGLCEPRSRRRSRSTSRCARRCSRRPPSPLHLQPARRLPRGRSSPDHPRQVRRRRRLPQALVARDEPRLLRPADQRAGPLVVPQGAHRRRRRAAPRRAWTEEELATTVYGSYTNTSAGVSGAVWRSMWPSRPTASTSTSPTTTSTTKPMNLVFFTDAASISRASRASSRSRAAARCSSASAARDGSRSRASPRRCGR